jgi:cell division protein FtsI/penicillin-binding protein 2
VSAAPDPRPLTRFQVRLLILGLMAALAVLIVSGRLFHLTVIAGKELQERAEHQKQDVVEHEARRGTIRDRNGRELALSVEVESIYAVPSAFAGKDSSEVAERLSTCLAASKRRIAAQLKGTKNFVWLERKANPDAVRCVRELDLPGVSFLDESRRFYPKRRLAAQILGYVGIDNEGMGGVEYALEKEIKGVPGRRIIWTDALRRRAGSRMEERSIPGRSVYLTIDENLQYIAETELSAIVQESRAKSGIAILMQPHTGELLAIASFPSFNPNRYGEFPESHRRNRSVTDVYEPGSTFKIVTAAAALEEGAASVEERIDCGGGSIRVADRWIRDSRSFDVLTFREVIEKSSNVGMIRIGQRLGKNRLEEYVRAFGFGQATGIELPGESRGILRASSSWGPVTAASITFGQEISVTPLQMVAAANVIATSGYLMRPRLVLGISDSDDGAPITLARPEPVRRVLQESSALRMTELLVGAVERGTGQRAAIAGYRVAGKTGTAQKAVPGGYSRTDYIASFVGFAPAERPALTALVILDSPEGDHSGSRAAGVFARIVERSLVYLGVPRSDVPVARFAKVWPQTRPILREEHLGPEGARKVAFASSSSSAMDAAAATALALAPDVLGAPARDAIAAFVAAGLVPEIEGTGFVREQMPSPGGGLEPGARARLVLGPPAPEVQPRERAPRPEPDVRNGVRVARASFDASAPGSPPR